MLLPKITNKQKQIIYLLYQFRFLNTYHIQKILGHKKPKQAQEWLKDLKDKGFINSDFKRKTFTDNIRPAIYYLNSKALHVIKEFESEDSESMNWIYKEKSRKKKFVDHCLAVADAYIFFLTQKLENEELNFFTPSRLARFDYFPQPLPSAYFSVKTESGVNRFFLDLFDDSTPPFVLRNRIKAYLEYFESGNWHENSNYSLFPSILFICPNKRLKNHIFFYSKPLLEKTFNDDIALFLTTNDKLSVSEVKSEIWEKVE